MEAIRMAEAKARFSDLISQVAAGRRFVIRRRDRDVAVLINPAELERLERAGQIARRLALALGQNETVLDKIERRQLHPAMAAFGLWRDDPDLQELADEIANEREQSTPRPGVDW
ncbi:MAG: type II toxin-antitoxin system prevent-host-death family antitoxin [Chloroflexota bacterium]